ncbi:protein of unknown function [Methylocaldum szegediense]|uniref:Uncharacterized protein n=1 Tax=Methylocaldum szegediense TaxID=73780 RepID=A0ABN8X672_9GAMM|nr:protein of unknown function [Methylocaldum szegediense]
MTGVVSRANPQLARWDKRWISAIDLIRFRFFSLAPRGQAQLALVDPNLLLAFEATYLTRPI